MNEKIPDISVGDPIRASYLNKLAKAGNRANALHADRHIQTGGINSTLGGKQQRQRARSFTAYRECGVLVLDSDSRSLEIVLDGAVATTQLDIVAVYVDFEGSNAGRDVFVPAANCTTTDDDNAVTMVASPLTGRVRSLKFLTVKNTDTADAVVTLRYDDTADSGSPYEIHKQTLAVGETLVYADGEGFRTITADGQVKYAGGCCSELDVEVDEDTAALDIGDATIVRLTCSPGVRIKGIIGGASCRRVLLWAVSGWAALDHDHADAAEEDRLYLGFSGGLTREWHLSDFLSLWYDPDVQKWRGETYPTLRRTSSSTLGVLYRTAPETSNNSTLLIDSSTIKDDGIGAQFTGNMHLSSPGGGTSVHFNYSTGASNYSELLVTAGTPVWNGMAAPTYSRQWHIIRNATALTVTITHLSADVTTEKRFACPGGADFKLRPGRSVMLVYWGSTASGKWNVIAGDSVYDITSIDDGDLGD